MVNNRCHNSALFFILVTVVLLPKFYEWVDVILDFFFELYLKLIARLFGQQFRLLLHKFQLLVERVDVLLVIFPHLLGVFLIFVFLLCLGLKIKKLLLQALNGVLLDVPEYFGMLFYPFFDRLVFLLNPLEHEVFN